MEETDFPNLSLAARFALRDLLTVGSKNINSMVAPGNLGCTNFEAYSWFED